ncbi:metallophosphoesterase [Desulfosporosinus sp. BICA1-9]|uniref:metallophosphoesterase family protein n=1 Tax=Desulfosporosinus sp. BICA1-9 TaxID=1531958 RepID=UPI000B33F7FB|nr:metallophosphoesterase [Desulfosporosinus sp. BICA1-9]KJS86281.1 MAG: hypothetical protein JL57_16870 [Desulfosporosinus sp. BICA1-9]HBW33919.1 metallophosphoesterase [Desulfosporosinus sp.]
MEDIKYADSKINFRFIVFGDSRGYYEGVNKAVFAQILRTIKRFAIQPGFFLFSGDMANEHSSSYEANKKALEEWKEIVEKYYPINRFYNCIGNHERNEEAFNDVFDYLPDGQLPGYGRTVYYIDYGNSRFIILNSNRENKNYYQYVPNEGSIKNEGYVIEEKQRNWLEDKLKSSDKKYNFVMFHVPAFPVSHHFGDCLDQDPIERYLLWDILDKYNVTALFNGHEHIYSRRVINGAFNTTFKNDIIQITTGGAGANIYGYVTDTRNNLTGPLGIYHYVVVDVYDRILSFKVFDIDSNIIDCFTVEKRRKIKPIVHDS